MIDVSEEYLGYKNGYKADKVKRKTENIYDRVLEILNYSDQNDITTYEAGIHFARKRIESIKKIKGHIPTRRQQL